MIYFNNAATSYPKPPRVISRMAEILQQMPVDPRRGEATGRDALFECRLRLEPRGCHDRLVVVDADRIEDDLGNSGLAGAKERLGIPCAILEF